MKQLLNSKDRHVKWLKRGDKVYFDIEMNSNPTKNAGKKLAINVELSKSSLGNDDNCGGVFVTSEPRWLR